MKTEGTYIKFVHDYNKPKTEVWNVRTKECGIFIGSIKWFPGWRKYCFFPGRETVFEVKCMNEIAEFLRELMTKHKRGVK